ncbi:MAG TPA: glycine cleavage system protein GcvH [Chitinispirillaceae bacterium]|nr:glycine cleavage system protein GcvH [Chitinispirillaceae bacterium]
MAPKDRKYAKTHEWVKIENNEAIVGITDHAQDSLGDITFIELPSIGAKLKKSGECGVIESVKAASDLYSPISGTVVEVNEALETTPEDVNNDPYEKGWIFKLNNIDQSEMANLMDADEYEKFLETEE